MEWAYNSRGINESSPPPQTCQSSEDRVFKEPVTDGLLSGIHVNMYLDWQAPRTFYAMYTICYRP